VPETVRICKGARLTAWELHKAAFRYVIKLIITDNMAALFEIRKIRAQSVYRR